MSIGTPIVETVITKDGTRIGWARAGDGPPLVLVHGTTADRARWRPVLPGLEERFTVYAVDRRGRGASGDSANYAIEREYEDIAAVLTAINGPVNLLGHSYGARCALGGALLAGNVRALVLYEPALTGPAPYPPGFIERLEIDLEAGKREHVVATFMQEIVRVPTSELEIMKASPAWQGRIGAAHTIVRELRAAERYRFEPSQYRSFGAPVLLLVGGASPAPFRSAIEELEAALPNRQLAVLPGQRHTAMDTGPEVFLAEVIRFLERDWLRVEGTGAPDARRAHPRPSLRRQGSRPDPLLSSLSSKYRVRHDRIEPLNGRWPVHNVLRQASGMS